MVQSAKLTSGLNSGPGFLHRNWSCQPCLDYCKFHWASELLLRGGGEPTGKNELKGLERWFNTQSLVDPKVDLFTDSFLSKTERQLGLLVNVCLITLQDSFPIRIHVHSLITLPAFNVGPNMFHLVWLQWKQSRTKQNNLPLFKLMFLTVSSPLCLKSS